MRTDETLARKSFRFSSAWEKNSVTGEIVPEIDRRLRGGILKDGKFVAHSLSGNERNRFFLSNAAKSFANLSTISGLDTPSDSRGSVFWDYDRDGWQDIAVVNANDPLLSIYHNDLGRIHTDDGSSRMVAIRFVGGNRSAGPSPFACRDGFGAMVSVSLGAVTLQREHRCGEGFASQNSATMIIGVGDLEVLPSLTVKWPSGKSQTIAAVPMGTLLTAYENPADSPGGEAFVREPYRRAPPADAKTVEASQTQTPKRKFVLSGVESLDPARPGLRVYTTMATWCMACKEHLPELEHLRSAFERESLNLIGVPVDKLDSPDKLRKYAEKWRPAYQLLSDLPLKQRTYVEAFLSAASGSNALPSTIVTDQVGNLLLVGTGVPSVSRLRQILGTLQVPPKTPDR